MKATLSTKDTVIIGFMLFALFFGAGNMIYPPDLVNMLATNVRKAIRWIFINGGMDYLSLGIIAIALTGRRCERT